MIKYLLANSGDIGDVGSIPGLKRYLEEEMAVHSSILVCEIPCAEEPASLGSQRIEHD